MRSLSAVGAMTLGVSWALAQGPATFLPIHAPTPYTDAEIVAISADGSVVAGTVSRSDGTSRAFRWTASTGVVLLDGLAPDHASAVRSISADGSTIVGLAIDLRSNLTRRACGVRWVGTSLPETIECPPETRTRTVSTSTNAVGNRVASASFFYSVTGAATSSTVWRPGNPFLFLNDASINCMSDDGLWTFGGIDCGTVNYFPQRAFRWNSQTFALTRIERPAGAPADGIMEALACSPDASVAVGAVGDRAFVWRNATGQAELLPHPPFGAFDTALGVDATGSAIVGETTTGTFVEFAVLWRHNVAEDLGGLLISLGAQGLVGGRLFRANDITPDGNTIVGQALLNDGSIVGYIAQLSGPACPADLDDGTGSGTPDGGVTIDDLLFYLTNFADGDVRADLDDGTGTGTPDGGVTIDDLLYYLVRFDAGC